MMTTALIGAALPTWAIAVIVVMGVLFLAAGGAIAFLLLFKPKAKTQNSGAPSAVQSADVKEDAKQQEEVQAVADDSVQDEADSQSEKTADQSHS